MIDYILVLVTIVITLYGGYRVVGCRRSPIVFTEITTPKLGETYKHPFQDYARELFNNGTITLDQAVNLTRVPVPPHCVAMPADLLELMLKDVKLTGEMAERYTEALKYG